MDSDLHSSSHFSYIANTVCRFNPFSSSFPNFLIFSCHCPLCWQDYSRLRPACFERKPGVFLWTRRSVVTETPKVCLCSPWLVVSVTIANIRPPASVPIATASWVTSGRSSVAPAWPSHMPETVWPPGGDWLSSLIPLQYRKAAPCSSPAWDAANPSAQAAARSGAGLWHPAPFRRPSASPFQF